MADADLDKKFNKAVWLIRNGPKAKEIDDDTCAGHAYTDNAHESVAPLIPGNHSTPLSNGNSCTAGA